MRNVVYFFHPIVVIRSKTYVKKRIVSLRMFLRYILKTATDLWSMRVCKYCYYCIMK